MDLSSRPSLWRFLPRRLWQRWATALPVGVAAWEELFAPHRDYRSGVFHARPGFSGILRRERGQPFTIEPVDYRGGAARQLPWDDRRYFTCEPDRVVYALSDACVYTHAGAVYDPHSRLVVAETLEEWEHGFARHPMFAAPGFPARESLAGRAFLVGGAGANTFYHFLVEALPALAFARDLAASCDWLLVPDGGREWKLRWLSLLGVDAAKIRWLPDLAHLRCEQLVFTSRVVRHFEPNPWAVAALRALPLAPSPDAPPAADVLWLDRTHMPARRVGWESDLVARLPGVTPVRFDALAPSATAARCAAARVLVGFHGAAMANMIFCRPGALVIEILTRPNFPWYGRLAQVCGHRHVALAADDAPASLENLARILPALCTPRPTP